MYSEKLGRKGFPIGEWLLKIFLVVIFAILIVYVLPAFLKHGSITNYKECKNGNCSGDLKSQVLFHDLMGIKNDIISIYTDENLPSEDNDSIITTFHDLENTNLFRNDDYDLDESYIEITKIESDYLLKISIKKQDVENYILLNIGHYPYCKDYLCEKNIL